MFRAIIFDFDGILTDTEPVHMQAWLSVLRPIGIDFGEAQYKALYLGLNDKDFLDAVGLNHRRDFGDREKGVLIERKAVASHRLLSENIPLIDGVIDAINSLSRDYPLAICSGALKSEVMFILNRLGWTERFRPIITQEDVRQGKPDPEGFLLTLRHLQQHRLWDPPLEAEHCLVVEDSPHGIEAAKAAGMHCVAITNSFKEDSLYKADKIIHSIGELPALLGF